MSMHKEANFDLMFSMIQVFYIRQFAVEIASRNMDFFI